MWAKNFRQTMCTLFSVMVLLLLNGCTTPKEQEKIDADNKRWAEEIAEEYFDEDFQYDFDFYSGGGEGGIPLYIDVFTDGDTIHCVAIPAREDYAGPFVHYGCTLHQYDSGGWSILAMEDSERVDLPETDSCIPGPADSKAGKGAGTSIGDVFLCL